MKWDREQHGWSKHDVGTVCSAICLGIMGICRAIWYQRLPSLRSVEIFGGVMFGAWLFGKYQEASAREEEAMRHAIDTLEEKLDTVLKKLENNQYVGR